MTSPPTSPPPCEPASGEDARKTGLEARLERERLAWSARREELARALRKAVTRVERRIVAIGTDIKRGEQASLTATRAGLFVAAAARAPRGTTELSAVDWASGEPETVTLPFDPAKTPREQLDAIFRTARRMKEGAKVAERRLVASREVKEALVSLLNECATLEPDADLEALAKRARRAAPHDLKLAPPPKRGETARRKTRDLPLPPYRTFRSLSGEAIYVGRGAEHNDELTFHVARPRDLFLHVHGHSGAHVIVPLRKGASCPPNVLVDAAHLAAHFSSAREETSVEVVYVQRGHVRKPRGSAPGLVVVDQGKTMWLRKEPGRVESLLAREGIDPA